uniref:Uncharacterized protein n=1 Tax=Panagrolaimus davidi TaxID=227884 RepID=A0A914PWA1_9BILA
MGYHLYKTHKPSKHIPPNINEIKSKPTVSNANVAIVETPTNQNLKLAKVEPNMNNENKSKKSQKKDKKKKTTQEPTTIEDVSTVSHQQSVAEAIPPFKQPPPSTASYPEVKRIIPRTIKSAEIDSFDEILKNDKSVMMECESVKF